MQNLRVLYMNLYLALIFVYINIYEFALYEIIEWGTLRFWGSRMIINSDLESLIYTIF